MIQYQRIDARLAIGRVTKRSPNARRRGSRFPGYVASDLNLTKTKQKAEFETWPNYDANPAIVLACRKKSASKTRFGPEAVRVSDAQAKNRRNFTQ
jgi:hypothetical protein